MSAEPAALGPGARPWRWTLGLGWPLALASTPWLLASGPALACPFRWLTGLPCPLCGGTHACAALLQGQWGAAWQAHPGAVPLLGLLSVWALCSLVEAGTGRRLPLGRWGPAAWTGVIAWLLGAWGLRLFGVGWG
ncbi:MAG: DUF2752 domain-containing protein [Burkholderiaceae bacterium]|nr:DUF2752 domain-containing protein [Burkholderiaceae bacterium]